MKDEQPSSTCTPRRNIIIWKSSKEKMKEWKKQNGIFISARTTLTDIHRIQFLGVTSIPRTYPTVFLTTISVYPSASPRSYYFRNAYSIRRPLESSLTGQDERRSVDCENARNNDDIRKAKTISSRYKFQAPLSHESDRCDQFKSRFQ